MLHARQVGHESYIADSGSGVHLVSLAKLKEMGLEKHMDRLKAPVKFHTTGGITECNYTVAIRFPHVSEDETVARVLDDTPAVISIGKWCVENDYLFVWDGKRKPYFQSPEGKIIYLDVDDFVPYFDVMKQETDSPSNIGVNR